MNDENSKKQKLSSGEDKSEKKKEKKKKPANNKMYTDWQDSSKMNSGNDIASEIKIANSKGAMEGGTDKKWHSQEGDLHAGNKADFEK